MSTLRKYQSNPSHLLNTALQLYKSKNIQTIVVEGICDKRFLNQWIKGDAIRFDGFDGKKLVEDVFLNSMNKPFKDYEFLYWFADIDYDTVTSKTLIDHSRFIYNAYCSETNSTIYNDLESYLINSYALEKIFSNLDISLGSVTDIRLKLEKCSRTLGKFRASDIVTQKKFSLRCSILGKLEAKYFFDSENFCIDEEELKKRLPKYSDQKQYVDDLIEIANKIDEGSPALWSLSRGHDLTEILALYFSNIKKRNISKDNVESDLRLACEFENYIKSPMGKKMYIQDHTDTFFNVGT